MTAPEESNAPLPAPRTDATRWVPRMAVGLGLGLATFLVFGLWADIGRLADAFQQFDARLLAPIFLLSLANYGIRAVRWHYYLRVAGHRVPPDVSVGVFASGLAMSVTPGKVGEVIKVGLLRQAAGVPGTRTFPVVVTERLADLFAVLGLAAAGVLVLHGNVEVLIGGGLLTATMFVLLATGPGTRLLFRAASVLLRGKIPVEAAQESAGLVRGLLSGPRLIVGLGLGVLAWFAEAAGLWLAVTGFPGGDLGIGPATFIYAVGTLAGALSFLPGGLIATEAALAVLLARSAFPGLEAGAAEVTAVASTMLIRIATLWFAVFVGVIGLLWLGRRLARRGA